MPWTSTFREAPLEQNRTVLLAMVGFGTANFWMRLAVDRAVTQDLIASSLLQQLDMKARQARHRGGAAVDTHLPVWCGRMRQQRQHAFFQLLTRHRHPADDLRALRATHDLRATRCLG